MSAALAPPARLPLDRDTVERFARGRDEPEWLRATRLEAADRFTPEAWPTGAEEEWRRFPLEGLPDGPLTGARVETRYAGPTENGISFGDLAAAAHATPDLVRRWIGASGGETTHAAFRAAADALWSAGAFVHVPAGVVVNTPLWIERRWARGPEAALSRTVIVLEPGSSATVVEEVSSEDGGPARLGIPHLDVHLLQGARLRYVRIQRLGDEMWDLGSQRFVSGRDSEVGAFNVLVGSGRSKLGVESDIVGDGATVKLYGLVAAGDTQRIDVNSFQRVDGKGSNSDLLYLSALYGAAKAVYYGVIRVEPTSSGTGSYQECRNMLLSDKAGADPIPVLEILTNDVARCGHGATAGALEDTELFYVMSRGLDREAAEHLLVRGFFQRVIDNLAEPQVRSHILAALAPRIGRLAELDELEPHA